MASHPLRVRDCSLCGFYRYRGSAFFYCDAWQETSSIDRRRCHFFSYVQPDRARIVQVRELVALGRESGDDFVPASDRGRDRLARRILGEMAAASAGAGTTALVTSGAKSQFETFSPLGGSVSERSV